MSRIHPTAVVHPEAEIAEGVEIGPYAVIGPEVRIGPGTVIQSHVRIEGRVTIGEGNRIYHAAAIGMPPQDVTYQGEDAEVVIGNHNLIREFVTIHRATGEGQQTRVGDHNFIMAYAHIAHNCRVGSHVILVNNVQLAGHVEVEDYAFVSGLVGVHQFTRIGAHAMVGGMSRINLDVPPYMLVEGNPPRVYGPNLVGLRRRGFSREAIQALKEAYRLLYRTPGLRLEEALEQLLQAFGTHPEIRHLVDFFHNSRRGVIRRAGGRRA